MARDKQAATALRVGMARGSLRMRFLWSDESQNVEQSQRESWPLENSLRAIRIRAVSGSPSRLPLSPLEWDRGPWQRGVPGLVCYRENKRILEKVTVSGKHCTTFKEVRGYHLSLYPIFMERSSAYWSRNFSGIKIWTIVSVYNFLYKNTSVILHRNISDHFKFYFQK